MSTSDWRVQGRATSCMGGGHRGRAAAAARASKLAPQQQHRSSSGDRGTPRSVWRAVAEAKANGSAVCSCSLLSGAAKQPVAAN